MSRVVYLDTGPLGLACNARPVQGTEPSDVQAWMKEAVKKGIRIIIPAIADYELRRELIRNGSARSIARLNWIESGQHPDFPGVVYLPLADTALKRAAELWARARNQVYATAGGQALDGDVIIAQSLDHAGSASRFTIAAGNVGDIARYVGTQRARLWGDIIP